MFRKVFSRLALPLWVSGVYFFLYIPLFVLVVFSFNSVAFPYRWVGFSLKWYHELFASSAIWEAARNSLFIGVSAVVLSLIIGLLFVMWNAQRQSEYFLIFFYPNLVIPEIVLAVGLLSFFIFFHVPLGLSTLIVAHTLLGLGYVIHILHTSVIAINDHLVEASFDLGATASQTFFKVILPILMPSLVAA